MTSKTAMLAGVAPRAIFHAPMTASPLLRGPQVAYSPDEGGALTVDQAISALREPETPEPAAIEDAPAGEPEAAELEAPEPLDPESEAAPTAEDLPDPEPVIEEPTDQEPESDPATPAIAAPQSWDASERAAFATLPPAAQEIILKRETERDRAVSKAQQEANAVRKTAEADLAGLAQFKTKFEQLATRADQVFADKWSNVDWVGLARADLAAYTIAKAEYDQDQGEVQRVHNAAVEADRVQQAAERVSFQNYVTEEFTKLATESPDLVDTKTGAAKRTEVTKFLLDRGIPQAAVERISAVEMALAYEAMQFRALKAQGKAVAARPAAQPATRQAAAPARAAAPSAAPPAAPPRQRNLADAMSRLSQSGRVDDALAVMRARRGA